MLLRNEVILQEHADDARPSTLELWTAHGLDGAVDDVTSGLRSLEMVRPPDCPPRPPLLPSPL